MGSRTVDSGPNDASSFAPVSERLRSDSRRESSRFFADPADPRNQKRMHFVERSFSPSLPTMHGSQGASPVIPLFDRHDHSRRSNDSDSLFAHRDHARCNRVLFGTSSVVPRHHRPRGGISRIRQAGGHTDDAHGHVRILHLRGQQKQDAAARLGGWPLRSSIRRLSTLVNWSEFTLRAAAAAHAARTWCGCPQRRLQYWLTTAKPMRPNHAKNRP